MNWLCMDTSTTFLTLGILQDGRVLGKIQEKCWKKQSEEIFPCLIRLFDECGMTPDDIDSIVISRGPGSYTGVRIAMSIAKVYASQKNLPLYTVSTLQLYAGKEDNCLVLVDARGGRAYTAVYDRGLLQGEEQAVPVQDIAAGDRKVIGDGHLIGAEDVYPDLVEHFLALKEDWLPAENVHLLVPEYLKPAAAYMVKK